MCVIVLSCAYFYYEYWFLKYDHSTLCTRVSQLCMFLVSFFLPMEQGNIFVERAQPSSVCGGFAGYPVRYDGCLIHGVRIHGPGGCFVQWFCNRLLFEFFWCWMLCVFVSFMVLVLRFTVPKFTYFGFLDSILNGSDTLLDLLLRCAEIYRKEFCPRQQCLVRMYMSSEALPAMCFVYIWTDVWTHRQTRPSFYWWTN